MKRYPTGILAGSAIVGMGVYNSTEPIIGIGVVIVALSILIGFTKKP